jgi:hypothetical protein
MTEMASGVPGSATRQGNAGGVRRCGRDGAARGPDMPFALLIHGAFLGVLRNEPFATVPSCWTRRGLLIVAPGAGGGDGDHPVGAGRD